MKIFGGNSSFGMSSKRSGCKRKSFAGMQTALEISDAEALHAVSATESLPGELRRRTQQSVTEDVRWMRRGLFKAGFNSGAPRLRGARKYTK